MKLGFDRKDVEAALLAYVDQTWPGMFNTVTGVHYERIPEVEFTFVEPKQEQEQAK